ncbi:TolC family protein [Aquimarina aquimarini]|uniref:TolC family protein n=1 Tax=Aquimarina aquimarini TaxID=1191734 RepID=UPI000D557752|nr:TolC family protein [Aquimarina aquimarini]
MRYLSIIIGSLLFFYTAEAQQLEAYIQEAMINNSQIQSFEIRHAIAKEKENETHTLPNTQISVGYFVSEPETRTGAQRAKISVQQMLPWFGTLTAREHYANTITEKEYLEVVVIKRKIALAIAQSYYKLYAIQSKQKIVTENINLLQTYEKLALTSVEVGKASVVDVLKLQIRQNELQQYRDVLKEQVTAEQASFIALINKKKDSIVVSHRLKIPLQDTEAQSEEIALNPEILTYDALYQSVLQSEQLNKKESAPQIGFGLSYIPVSERSDMIISDNGKDIIMPMVSLSIPIFNKQYNSITRQNELHQERITAEKEERINQLTTILANALSNRNKARIQNNTQQKNLEQAKNAEKILVKSYETGTIDFNDILDIQELQLKFQLNQIESIQQYYMQTAIINYLTNQ